MVGAAAIVAGAGFVAVSGIRVDVDPSKECGETRPTLGGPTWRPHRVAPQHRRRHHRRLFHRHSSWSAGFLTVLLVSVSFDLLDLGNSGIGWLAAAMGIGGIAGGYYAVGLTGRRQLGQPFAFALLSGVCRSR